MAGEIPVARVWRFDGYDGSEPPVRLGRLITA
jgi:hypothetical protein